MIFSLVTISKPQNSNFTTKACVVRAGVLYCQLSGTAVYSGDCEAGRQAGAALAGGCVTAPRPPHCCSLTSWSGQQRASAASRPPQSGPQQTGTQNIKLLKLECFKSFPGLAIFSDMIQNFHSICFLSQLWGGHQYSGVPGDAAGGESEPGHLLGWELLVPRTHGGAPAHHCENPARNTQN